MKLHRPDKFNPMWLLFFGWLTYVYTGLFIRLAIEGVYLALPFVFIVVVLFAVVTLEGLYMTDGEKLAEKYQGAKR